MDAESARSVRGWGSPVDPTETASPEEELLQQYLKLSGKRREEVFAQTARAAEVAGVSQRTIQGWVATGAVEAVLIGRRYHVSLKSLTVYLRSRANRS
jgi:hypothetical protein